MKLCVRSYNVDVPEPVVMLNRDDCLKMGVDQSDRVRITSSGTAVCSIVVADEIVHQGCVAVPAYVLDRCGSEDGSEVTVEYCPPPTSVSSIRRKINGEVLGEEEIHSIVQDIMTDNLSDKEVLAFVSAFNVNNADISEVAALTKAMASTGAVVDFGTGRVFDFHSLGGISGNKITPMVVSIVASEGLIIPKLSSRAVSSACGTADFVDTFCDVEVDSDRLCEMVRNAGGVFACGNEDYAPVGRKIIRVESPMGIDPYPTMMASIMSKKVALGTTDLVMDVPVGKGSKLKTLDEARSFSRDLVGLGSLLGMKVECVATRADEPLGRAVGPILEARECISILENGSGDEKLIDKACSMAGAILDMSGCIDGRARAREILESGRAYDKFMEICVLQNGRCDLKSSDLIPGGFCKDVHSKFDGYVQYIDNHCIVAIAKAAGAPKDVGAGIEFLHKTGDRVRKGDVLFRIYAESESKLKRAIESAYSRRPMSVSDTFAEHGGDIVIERMCD